MKLLIITQKVDINDDVLGFMHGWITEFARQCERVTVICLQKGECHLPDNVRVLSLGKEENNFKFFSPRLIRPGQTIFNFQSIFNSPIFKKLKYIFRFWKYIFTEKKNYDAVFVHMNQIYVILGWPLWKILHKKISLWYAHGHVSASLRLAEKLTDVVFTSTKSGFRLPSKKVKIIGQGIDINKFSIFNYQFSINDQSAMPNNKFHIVTVGRISPVKDYETLIKAVDILRKENVDLWVTVIGGADTDEQKQYWHKLQTILRQENLEQIIKFIGPVANKDLAPYLQAADLFVNMSRTGSLDKAMLEAAACGLPVITCNEAMQEVLGQYAPILMYQAGDNEQLTNKLKTVMIWGEKKRRDVGHDLRKIVVQQHSLPLLISKILAILKYNYEINYGVATAEPGSH